MADISLSSLIDFQDQLCEYLDMYGLLIPVTELENKIIETQTYIKNLQLIAKQLADVSNKINRLIIYRKKNIKGINVYPDIEEYKVLRNKIIKYKIATDISHMTCANIYFINNINRYGVNIAGIPIYGTICNISNKITDVECNCDNAKCKRWHGKTTRQLANGSYIYNPNSKYLCRKVGNFDTLYTDIKKLTPSQYKQELELRRIQLMHDILVYQFLTFNN